LLKPPVTVLSSWAAQVLCDWTQYRHQCHGYTLQSLEVSCFHFQ
jgi:hypothetical protein